MTSVMAAAAAEIWFFSEVGRSTLPLVRIPGCQPLVRTGGSDAFWKYVVFVPSVLILPAAAKATFQTHCMR